jgi:Uma2 family endonuclease
MAIAERELKRPKVLTYEDYLSEGEVYGRYDIINGVRQFMTSPQAYHQIIAQNIYDGFRTFAKVSNAGRAFVTSIDIVIRRDPLQVRQPDVMLFSTERWGDRGPNTPMPITSAPELVVEIKSPSNTSRTIAAKMREYASVGVLECWLVKIDAREIEKWDLAAGVAPVLVATYGVMDTIVSVSFPELSVGIADVFEF